MQQIQVHCRGIKYAVTAAYPSPGPCPKHQGGEFFGRIGETPLQSSLSDLLAFLTDKLKIALIYPFLELRHSEDMKQIVHLL